jgi:acyl-CoA thioesterase-1
LKRWRAAAICLLVLVLAGTVPALAADEESCPGVPIAPLVLPATKSAAALGQPIVIVSLGSSSSRGAGASDAAHSYPAILQVALNRLMPKAHISVINRGNDGEDATQELARLGIDILALAPRLVIWQVGANGALRGTDPAVFRALVTAGVSRLTEAGADVILMDNQRAPKILNAPNRKDIEDALADVAVKSRVNLFSRGALMDTWRDQDSGYDMFLSPDGLHHNDRGYRCLAEALAGAISAALTP